MNIAHRTTICLLGLVLSWIVPRAISQTAPGQDIIDASTAASVATNLAGRQVASPPVRTRSGNDLSALYRAAVLNVPVVLSESSLGSSVVTGVTKDRHAFVITNNHVVERPITRGGKSAVILVFYDPELKNQMFDPNRFSQCFSSAADGDWCNAVRRSSRLATILRTDPSRDLALLYVANVPTAVSGLQPADINALQPGDSVAAIGHPTGLLWSLTTGIISAVRTHMMIGNEFGTVIQTQAAINPGNSGGPLLGADGKVAGVIFASRAGQTLRLGTEAVTMPTEGLNYAIGIDTALAFTHGGDK